ncbi:hypothetical protein ACIQPP_05340 [Streptomyces violaceusniger]|uniref:hypothetical protein n=1 Tax=Streptomyces violaceusniger TaxID=68280 RepID=UPI000997398E|nr:hypothetical protein [Streptomyces hygroscopicus]AQW55245.1 hypothetical protein SHXM_08708 [Streptomyces hygroscopicus]
MRRDARETPPVDGPFRIYVDPIPAGVELDITAFVEALLLTIVRDEADTIAEIAELDQSAQHAVAQGNTDSHAGHERDTEIERLADRLGAKLPVYGRQMMRLAERLLQLSQPRPVPAQREGGAAA